MAVIETWYNQDLQKPVKTNYLDGNLFTNNGSGNMIGVRVFNNGSPATLTGTVSGYVVTADGSTVPCTGALSGNAASILIPPAAYQPGAVFITIFLTDGETVTTLAAVSTSVLVARTDTLVPPGSVIEDWTETINAAMQAVEEAAENLGGVIAVPYADIAFPVPIGKYTYYNGNVYRCISPIASSESFTSSHWVQVVIGDELETTNTNIESMKHEIKCINGRFCGKYVSSDFIDGIYLDSITNLPFPVSGYSTSQYFPVADIIETNAVQHSDACIVFYNANLTPIGNTKNYSQIAIPSGAKYFRVSNYTSSQANPTVTLYWKETDELRNGIFGNSYFLVYEANISGYFINTSTGEALANANYRCSEFIDIRGCKPILETYFYSQQAGFAFYDENKVFISGFNTYNYTLPANAKYIRFSAHADAINKMYLPVQTASLFDNTMTFYPSIQGYIDITLDGQFFYHQYYKSTDFIPVPVKLSTTCVQNSNACLAFYDKNRVFVSATKDYTNITVPNNAAYFRISDYDENNQQTGYVICEYIRNAGNQDNPIYGKKLVFVGDSLTAVYYKTESESWPALIAARNNATAVNLGISGNPIAESSNYTEYPPMCDRLSSIPSDADYIMLMGGANDFNLSIPIGQNSDTVKTTFKGALNYTLNYLVTNYPKAKILLATTYRRNADRNDEVYANAMIDICNLHEQTCLDVYHAGGVHFFNEAWMTIFGAWTWNGDASQKMSNRHLNAKGDALVSTMFESKLKSL